MNIGKRAIGEGQPCYIIAEAGVNHNGESKIARQLVDAAVEAGADAVKFQTFRAELLVTEDAQQAEYQTRNIGTEQSQYAMLKRLELTEEDFEELKAYCAERGIDFLSTPHSDTWSVDLLEKLSIAAFKMGSGDLTNFPILKYVAKKKKPVILSTGMATMEEVLDACSIIRGEGNDQVILLHCTTKYPCPEQLVNLKAMLTIKEKTEAIVGYSDHTLGIETAVIAVCMGASLYEKHFTIDKSMEGPDHKASLEPKELRKMIAAMRYVEEQGITDPHAAFEQLNQQGYALQAELIDSILGSSAKRPEPEESEIAKMARKSIVAVKDIAEGETLTAENIAIRRPGEGLHPRLYNRVIGTKARKKYKKNEYIER